MPSKEGNSEDLHDETFCLKKIAYSAPVFALAVVGIPVYVYIPKFYTDVVGVQIGVLGFLLMAVRIFDAVTDPLIGYMTDRTLTSFGRRRPYIALSSVALSVSLSLLFNLTGERREGRYIGLWSLAKKLSAALGVGISLSLLSHTGYMPNMEQSEPVRMLEGINSASR